METRPLYRNTLRPQGSRLRKVTPEDDYVDYVHEQTQPGRRKPHWWRVLPGGWIDLAALTAICLGAGAVVQLPEEAVAAIDPRLLSLLALALLAASAARRVAGTGISKPLTDAINGLQPWQQALAYGTLHLAYFWAGVWIALKILTGASPIV